ncbi:MAG: Hsp70 family protein [Pseudomonadota bacterium]
MTIPVGIDLGTSYSCVAAFIDGQPTVLADDEGKRTQPSVVAFGYDGVPVVGWRAQRQLMYAPESTVNSPKRLMGRRFRSAEVKRLAMNVGYELVESTAGEVLIRVRGREYSVPEISAFVLDHMRKIAEKRLGQKVDQAVITVPAYFNDHQRQATREAARLAGLECLRIINEPTAAALAYGLGQGLKQNVAVYDLGGGTFDISVLKLEEDVYEVVGTAGDTFLGGDDFDAAVARHFLKGFQRRSKVNVKDNRVTWLRLMEAAEQAKIALGESNEVEVNVPGVAKSVDGRDVVLSTRIDRLTYAQVVMPLVQRTFQVCDESLKLAGLSTNQIDGVLLVGGMVQLFLVQEAVEHYFQRPVSLDHNPNEVVAQGAALQAHNLAGVTPEGQVAPNMPLLLDVTPRSLGVGTVGGFVEAVIPRNSPIPTEQTKIFHPAFDQQTEVRITAYQGESRKVDQNEKLGEFMLDGLRPAARGDVRVEVTFQIDADGIVHVIARDPETKNERDLKIVLDKR